MGENADIKRYDFHPENEELTLFATSASKSAVVTRLLEAKWLARASALSSRSDASLGKRYDEPLAVHWDRAERAPRAFFWRRSRYTVDELLATWVVEAYWWDDAHRMSRSYWRVRAGGGVYDLYFDRLAKRWFMGAVVD